MEKVLLHLHIHGNDDDSLLQGDADDWETMDFFLDWVFSLHRPVPSAGVRVETWDGFSV